MGVRLGDTSASARTLTSTTPAPNAWCGDQVLNSPGNSVHSEFPLYNSEGTSPPQVGMRIPWGRQACSFRLSHVCAHTQGQVFPCVQPIGLSGGALLTRNHRDGVLLDQGMGRSAYLCPQESCFEEAQRRKRLQKALRCQVPDSVLEELRQRLNSDKEPVAEAR